MQFELAGTGSSFSKLELKIFRGITGPRIGTRTFFFLLRTRTGAVLIFLELELEILHQNQELPNTALYSS